MLYAVNGSQKTYRKSAKIYCFFESIQYASETHYVLPKIN